MYQANQKLIAASTNIALISIRQAEIDYFSTFFTNFGTQCALIIGVLAGSVSQTPGFECPQDCNYFWQIFYNINVAICTGVACLVFIATVFITVYGEGLAIRGEAGSMIKTIHGMIAEQHLIVYLFVLVIATYLLQYIGMYFIVMDWEVATFCACMTVLSG
jgi:hypothetical protein